MEKALDRLQSLVNDSPLKEEESRDLSLALGDAMTDLQEIAVEFEAQGNTEMFDAVNAVASQVEELSKKASNE